MKNKIYCFFCNTLIAGNDKVKFVDGLPYHDYHAKEARCQTTIARSANATNPTKTDALPASSVN
jgi:hypothetical protein